MNGRKVWTLLVSINQLKNSSKVSTVLKPTKEKKKCLVFFDFRVYAFFYVNLI